MMAYVVENSNIELNADAGNIWTVGSPRDSI